MANKLRKIKIGTDDALEIEDAEAAKYFEDKSSGFFCYRCKMRS